MFGFLGTNFGRSGEIRRLDTALHAVDVHPRLVQDAMKLAAVRLIKEEAAGRPLADTAFARVAELIGYLVIGAHGFAGANGEVLARNVEERIARAVEAGDGPDARIVLLVLQAGFAQPSVIEEFGLAVTDR